MDTIEYKQAVFDEMKRVLPCLGISVLGDSFDNPCLVDNDDKTLVLDNHGYFNGEKKRITVGCTEFTRYYTNYNNFMNNTDIIYEKNPFININLVDYKEIVKIIKHFDNYRWFEINITTTGTLGNLTTDIGIYFYSKELLMVDRECWGYMSIIHNGSNSEFIDPLTSEVDSTYKHIDDVIIKIKDYLSEAINFIIKKSCVSEDRFSGLNEAIDKALELIKPGMTELNDKKKERLKILDKPANNE